MKIAFVTGARSEYGLAKSLLRLISADKRYSLEVIANGMHFLSEFGNTIHEIESDGFKIIERLETYKNSNSDKFYEFITTIEMIGNALQKHKPNAILVIGDRIEAYGAALAAHFKGIPIIHSGGGNLTLGAVDDIYRYNISNLSQLHLTTSLSAYERLKSSPILNARNIHFTGSIAIDSIRQFQLEPRHIREFIPELKDEEFALMTFHSSTAKYEPTADLMDASIKTIINHNSKILITYPNNDAGSESILKVIQKYSKNPNVYISKSLGATGYYAALHASLFVIGNSSSGIIEAPYFDKPVINIGERQAGRDKDAGVIDIPANTQAVTQAISDGYRNGWTPAVCHNLYGDGNSAQHALHAINNFMESNTE